MSGIAMYITLLIIKGFSLTAKVNYVDDYPPKLATKVNSLTLAALGRGLETSA